MKPDKDPLIMFQLIEENLETMTATAMNAHKGHFSKINLHALCQPGGNGRAGSSGFPLKFGLTTKPLIGAAVLWFGIEHIDIEEVVDTDVVGCSVAGSGFPRSFSPMLGKSCNAGKQCYNIKIRSAIRFVAHVNQVA